MNSTRSFKFELQTSEEWLEEHAHSRYHNEQIPNASHAATLASPHCSDTVTVQLILEDQSIKQAWHTAQGCLVAQASASFLCQWSEGKHLDGWQ